MTLESFAQEYSQLAPGDQAQFTETVRRLLADGLVWREEEADRSTYAFLVRRRDLVSDYLRLAGWELHHDERNGIFQVRDPSGAHRRRLDRETTLWLLLLRLLYAEQRENMTVTLNRYPVVTVGQLIQRYAEFFPGRAIRKKTSLEEGLRTLRAQKLIRAAGGGALRVNDPDQVIELLPTLEVVIPPGNIAGIAERLREFNRQQPAETENEAVASAAAATEEQAG